MPFFFRTSDFRSWVDHTTGWRLKNALYSAWVDDGQIVDDANPAILELRFDRYPGITFSCHGDGTSLTWKRYDEGHTISGNTDTPFSRAEFTSRHGKRFPVPA